MELRPALHDSGPPSPVPATTVPATTVADIPRRARPTP